jgi:hypothetical protein
VLVLAEVAVAFPLLELCQDLGDECFCRPQLVGAALLRTGAKVAKPSIGSSLDFRLILFWDSFGSFIVVHVTGVSTPGACWSCLSGDGSFSRAHKRAGLASLLLTATWHWLRWEASRETRDCNKSVSG